MGDYDFNLTRTEIIESAYRKLGTLSPGQILSGEQMEVGIKALNLIVKAWRDKGIWLWTHKKYTQSLATTDKDYTLNQEILSIDRAYVRDGTTDCELEVISYREYELILDKSVTGRLPTVCALDYTVDAPVLYLYPTPVFTGSLNLYYIATTKLKDMDTASGTPEIPSEHLIALIYDLVSFLSDDEGIDLKERNYFDNKAEMKIREAKKRDIDPSESVVLSAFPSRRRFH